DHLGTGKELVEVVQEKQRRAVRLGQGGQSAQSSEGIAGAGVLSCAVRITREPQAVSDVPDRDFPLLAARVAHDLAFGFVGFKGLYPDATEGGIYVARQIIG